MAEPLPETASQTAGPYVHIGCTPNQAGVTGVYPVDLGKHMITDATRGDRITLTGCVFDGTGAPLCDALVEAWQPDSEGRFAGTEEADPQFAGFGRCPCDPVTGVFRFDTVRPGPVPWPVGGLQAPHITLWIVARGINIGLHTRAYFADDPAIGSDPALALIADQRRAQTLLAQPQGDGRYHINIHLQGPDETVFFDI